MTDNRPIHISEEREREIAAFIERLAAVSSGNSTICIVCGEPFDHLEQVGRCVYARPCGDRQYQGVLPGQVLSDDDTEPRSGRLHFISLDGSIGLTGDES